MKLPLAPFTPLLLGLLWLAPGSTLHAQSTANQQLTTRPEVMQGFMDKRFGMFIHWGPVTLRGTEIGWSRGKQVPATEYDQLYKEFDPVLFDADNLIRQAKEAGMQYVVITTRHHDGFCLWPTATTPNNIMNTPYKKDIVGALATACKKYGLAFCCYYSILDWADPDYTSQAPSVSNPKGNMPRYKKLLKAQLNELITKYDPYLLWFDGEWEDSWTHGDAVDLYGYLKALKKDLIINNRIDKGRAGLEGTTKSGFLGDYDTPEQQVGRLNMTRPWESCMTFGDQWSWKHNDKLKSLPECLAVLAGTAGGNGNLLLNVSPMPDGRLEARHQQRLAEIGQWMHRNGKAVYKTEGGPYTPNSTYTATRSGNSINLILLRQEQLLQLKTLPGRAVLKAHWLDGDPVPFSQNNGSLLFTLSGNRPDPVAPVLVLELDGPATTLPILAHQ